MIKYPDYDNSILSVISSILKYYGYDTGHKSLEVLDKELDKKYKNVVLMLFDGMGESIIRKHLRDTDFLMQHYKGIISSVCPSTTACAIPTVESGLTPLEHSWLGWDMYFKDYDANITLLKNTYQESNQKVEECVVAEKYIKYYNVFDRIKDLTNGRVVTHDVSKYSDTDEFVYSCEEMMRKIAEISKNGKENYIYTYLEEPDSVMHAVGTEHEYVKENVRYINSLVYELSQTLENSLIIVIADHGLIDTKTAYLEDYPRLQNMLVRRPSMESRALDFFVKEEYKSEFRKEFEKNFKDKFILLSKDEIIEKKMFGEGKIHPLLDEFVGDYVAFAISDLAIEWENDGFDMQARHAGLTREEMEVPLFIIDTNEV